MSIRRLTVLFAVALTLTLSSLPVNAQQPRAVPPNDNFIDARLIKIGKNYSVPDIGAATNQSGEPVSSCKLDAVVPNSVWFTFTLPKASHVYLSTFGSIFFTGYASTIDTVLTVYELTGPATFTQVICSDDASGNTSSNVSFTAIGGKIYYVAVGTFMDEAYLPHSVLKLTSRLLSTDFDMINESFDQQLGNTGWQVKNGEDDLIVCANAAYPGASGPCTFRFTGTPDTVTKLVQTMPFPPAFAPRKNALITSHFRFRVMTPATVQNTKIKLIISYTDGTPPSAETLNLDGAPQSDSYESGTLRVTLNSSKVDSIKVLVKYGAPGGNFLFDHISFFYGGDASNRDSRLLPVPPAAK